jgi:predicted nucleotidyltransferase
VEHKETGVRVNFIFSLTGFEREAIEKAREITVEDMPIRYISPGDLIVQKVIAGRAVDLEDVRGILDMQGEAMDKKKVEERITALSREMGVKQWLTRWKKVKT